MATNNELIEAINAEAEALGVDAPATEGLTNTKLANALRDLKQQSAEPEQVEEKHGHFVAKGSAITTARGILSDGDEITADDLPGGKETLAAFVKSGHIVKK